MTNPGSDERSDLLYEPSGQFPAVPDRVSQADAKRAAAELLNAVADFPFAEINGDGGAAHRHAWLAGVLTPLARHAIDGPCHLHLFDANTAGSGKSKLCDIVAMLATGRDAARQAIRELEDEFRKRILSIAIEGDRIVLIDNVASGSALGGATLDAAFTSQTIKGRILGKSEMTRDLPMSTV